MLEAINKTKRMYLIYLTQCEALWSQESETAYQIAKIIVLYVLPLLLMSVTYYQIVRVLWKSDNIPGHTETVQMFNANAYNGGKRNRQTICVPGKNNISGNDKCEKEISRVTEFRRIHQLIVFFFFFVAYRF